MLGATIELTFIVLSHQSPLEIVVYGVLQLIEHLQELQDFSSNSTLNFIYITRFVI